MSRFGEVISGAIAGRSPDGENGRLFHFTLAERFTEGGKDIGAGIAWARQLFGVGKKLLAEIEYRPKPADGKVRHPFS